MTTYQKILCASIDRTLGASYARDCHETRLGEATHSGLVLRLLGSDRLWIGDLAHPITVAAGDSISIKVAPTSTPAAARISWGIDFVVADAGDGGVVDTLLSRGDA